MKKISTILAVVMLLVVLFTAGAFAKDESRDVTRDAGRPTMTVTGASVQCTAKVTFWNQSIDATLELYQGSTLVAWWTKTGTGLVSFSEPAPFISGLSYTLTISGTANGIAFTPQSITQTLW